MNEDKEQLQIETQQELTCGESEDVASSEVFKSQVAKDLFIPAKTFNWGRDRLVDCEWREGYLTIFEDGRYDGKMNLRCNKGSFYSCDSMATEFFIKVVKVVNDKPERVVIFSFQAPTRSVAGNDDTDIYYSGRGEAIRSYFNDIRFASRSTSGYCS
jgi:hypothetical protein